MHCISRDALDEQLDDAFARTAQKQHNPPMEISFRSARINASSIWRLQIYRGGFVRGSRGRVACSLLRKIALAKLG